MTLLQSYQLFIRVHRACDIQIGKLGRFHFLAGEYVYTGSARKNIEARVRRHLAHEKKLRWHIDYLLTDPNVEVYDSELFAAEECALNQAVSGRVMINGFGASDCRKGCGSHLKYTGT